ncbi:MAG TPA: nuclear transport factor 2 family protein [Sunxiuqinia sp.]|nr:nuclear transport factor 2 family protein [Sunxiuqinia sp.]
MNSCTPKVDLKAEKTQVKAAVDDFATVLENEDMNLLKNLMAHDADMVCFGTDASERWVGYDALQESVQQQFAAFSDAKIDVSDQVINVNPTGNTAWFSEVMDWSMKVDTQMVNMQGVRMTGVLEKQDGKWVFVQFHTSVPVSGQAAEY